MSSCDCCESVAEADFLRVSPPVVLGLQRAQRVRVFKEGAPVEEPGQMISAAN
jgi:hypothetical protein